LKASFFGHVFEGAILLLTKEAVPMLGPGFLWDRPFRHRVAQRRSIHDKDIQPTVIVVVK
jgi:hypothetical protein